MTTTASGREATSACNGVTTIFPVPFQFLSERDLDVYLLDAAEADLDLLTPLTEGVHYTIDGDGRIGQASVVTNAAFPAGKWLKRWRRTSRAQNADYRPNEGFPAASHETQLDRLSLVTEELDSDLGKLEARAVRVPEPSVPTCPPIGLRRNKLFGWANDGSPTAIAIASAFPGISTMLPNHRIVMAGYTNVADGQSCILTEYMREGVFVFHLGPVPGDLPADPAQGRYVRADDGSGYWERLGELHTRHFGALHDDDNDDQPAIQDALDLVRDSGGGKIIWSEGIALTSDAPWLWDDTFIIAEVPGRSGIRNPGLQTGEAAHGNAAFRTGYWGYNWNGQRTYDPANPAPGGSTPFERKIDMYATAGAVERKSRLITLASAADAAHFVPGKIYYLRDAAVRYRVSPPTAPAPPAVQREIEIPLHNRFVRVKSVAGAVVEIERPIGFDAPGAYLCKIKDGATDTGGRPIYIVQNIRIEGLWVDSKLNFHNMVGIYGGKFKDITGNLRIITGGNGYAYVHWDGFKGTFTRRVCEVKFGSHDSIIENIEADCLQPDINYADPTEPNDFDRQVGGSMISFGEHIQGVTLRKFRIRAPTWGLAYGSPPSAVIPINIRQAEGCHIEDGYIEIPGAAATPLVFGAGEAPADGCTVRNIEIVHAAPSAVVFQGALVAGHVPAKGCKVIGYKSVTSAASTYAVVYNGGENNEVAGGDFNAGGIQFFGGAGNKVHGSDFGDTAVAGAAMAANRQYNNFKKVAGALDVPITPTPKLQQFVALPAIGAGAKAAVTFTVPNVAVGDRISVSFAAAEPDLFIIGAAVVAASPAANNVRILVENVGGAIGTTNKLISVTSDVGL